MTPRKRGGAALSDGSWGVTLGRIAVCSGECVVCREPGGVGEGLDEGLGGGGGKSSLGTLGWVAHISMCSTMATLEVGGGCTVAERVCMRGPDFGQSVFEGYSGLHDPLMNLSP